MESSNPHRAKQPYPWLEPFGFRLADRVSLLGTDGQWTFQKANGQPLTDRDSTDTADACVGTSDDPDAEVLGWTDAATQENERLREEQEVARSRAAFLRTENKELRKRLEVAEYERKKMELAMAKEQEKMKARSVFACGGQGGTRVHARGAWCVHQ